MSIKLHSYFLKNAKVPRKKPYNAPAASSVFPVANQNVTNEINTTTWTTVLSVIFL